MKLAVWALKTNIYDYGQSHHHCHVCHSHTSVRQPLSQEEAPHALLHARCQTLSTYQLEYPPDTGFFPFHPTSKEDEECQSHLSSHMPVSVNTSQLIHSFIDRGREPRAGLSFLWGVRITPSAALWQ